jgi:hypothetical protein
MRVPTSCRFYSSLSFQNCLGIWEQVYNLKLSASYKFSFLILPIYSGCYIYLKCLITDIWKLFFFMLSWQLMYDACHAGRSWCVPCRRPEDLSCMSFGRKPDEQVVAGHNICCSFSIYIVLMLCLYCSIYIEQVKKKEKPDFYFVMLVLCSKGRYDI